MGQNVKEKARKGKERRKIEIKGAKNKAKWVHQD
jgi:hypothetical protein